MATSRGSNQYRDYAADQTSREIHADTFGALPEQRLAAAVVHVAISEAGHRGLPTPDKFRERWGRYGGRPPRSSRDREAYMKEESALRRAERRAIDAMDFFTTSRCHGWLALMTPDDIDIVSIQQQCIEQIITLRRERNLPTDELTAILAASRARASVLHQASVLTITADDDDGLTDDDDELLDKIDDE